MKRSICGKAECPRICVQAGHCAAGQQRSRAAFAAYAIKLAGRRLARLPARKLPLEGEKC